ncbi:MAG TPA: triose-phosphate isomerase [Candidatus Binatia bacterium]|nr:triose-phosphate isomerase [Candidatus Binatia bacterium]
MSRPLVVGNWKMHGGQSDCVERARAIVRELKTKPATAQVVLAPPFTALVAVGKVLRASPVQLAAQNCHWQLSGAFTGEISPAMIRELGCEFVILGHSERRHILHETDDMVAQKIMPAIAQGMRPILCVGETLAERQREQTFSVIGRQLESALKGLGKDAIENIEIAYEPVWAIGTGHNASPEQIREVHAKIRECLAGSFGAAISEKLRILYGGSVKPENAAALAGTDEVNGFLVGGASLQADSFVAIAQAFS